MSKPITKALHTVRVFKQIAAHLRATSGHVETDAGADMYYRVLKVLDNVDPVGDPTLRAALIDACTP